MTISLSSFQGFISYYRGICVLILFCLLFTFIFYNICHHCVAVAIHTERVEQIIASFPGRSLTRVSTSSAPKSVGTKVPPRKRPREEAALPPQASVDEERSHQFTAEAIGDTTVMIRKSAKPSDPPPSAPLVTKSISGGIRKCAGCKKPLSTIIKGYNEDDDKMYEPLPGGVHVPVIP